MFATRARLLALAAALVTPAVFAAGDVENGKAIFAARCGICHAVNKEPGAPAMGPNMVGVVGRKAGALPDFALYSAALKGYDVKWNAKTLDAFLANPMTTVPGTSMYMVLPDEKERADVIAYLESLK